MVCLVFCIDVTILLERRQEVCEEKKGALNSNRSYAVCSQPKKTEVLMRCTSISCTALI